MAGLKPSLPGPEFVVGLRLWLGAILFPLSPLCTCLSLLGCSHGPMRIRCHNTLVKIIYNALSQDHPGVFKEQRALHDDLWPGDIFHPEFEHGRSAYFDVSVCNTIQPVGSDFVPLVVECFGVWTPFALKMLKVIADHTTSRSGVPSKLARKNLLQQLFCCTVAK